MSIAPTFSFSLGQAVLPGPMAVGRFDGVNMSLACAASGGRVVIHTSTGGGGLMKGAVAADGLGGPGPAVRLLNINRDVKCLAASSGLGLSTVRDVLVVGTTGAVQAYDVHENRDLFYRDTTEPVTALAVGPWPYVADSEDEGRGRRSSTGAAASSTSAEAAPHVVFSGGNCSVTGCHADGSDAAWSVAGDVVTALALADVDGDGRPELIVGAADAEIRVLQGDTVAAEITEGDKVTALAHIPLRSWAGGGGGPGFIGSMGRSGADDALGRGMGGPRGGAFAFGLANGTVGVYGCGAAVAGSGARTGVSSASSSSGPTSFSRLWRVKVKSRAVAVVPFDFDQDGVPEIACGWASGRLEIRKASTGEVLFREQYSTAVAGLAVGDYRADGSPVLLVVTTDGQVRAIPRVDGPTLAAYRAAAGLGPTAPPPIPTPINTSVGRGTPSLPTPAAADDDDTIAALMEEKRSLEALLQARERERESGRRTDAGSIPANAGFKIDLAFDHAARRVELQLTSSTSDVVLRGATALCQDAPLFSGGREAASSVAPYQAQAGGAGPGPAGLTVAQANTLHIPLPLKHGGAPVAADLTVTAIVAPRASAVHCAAITKTYRLPPFPAFHLLPGGTVPGPGAGAGATTGWDPQAIAAAAALPIPSGCVTFHLKERAARLAAWVSSSFPCSPLSQGITAQATPHLPSATAIPPLSLTSGAPPGASIQQQLSLDVRFAVLRPLAGKDDGSGRPSRQPLSMLRIALASEHGGPAVIQCEDVGLAGEVLQSLALWAGITDLDSTADFPGEMEAFRAVLQRVSDGHAVRTKLTGEMAESSSLIKALVVEAEDARLLGEVPTMRSSYGRLRGITGDLLREYTKRASAHTSLMDSLRSVNGMISKAAALRVGEPRSRVVTACRAALKANNPQAMIAAITSGKG